MTLDCLTAIRRLNEVSLVDYFRSRSMPEFVEPLLTEFVASFVSSPESRRAQVLSAVSPGLCSVLGWYARKLAGQAVREGSRADIRNGLISLAISASKEDLRDIMAPLALLYNSAILLGEDPHALFEATSRMSTQSVVELFQAFLDRPSEKKAIRAFGFSEGVGPYGFDYVPLLPEFGGPVPL